jgi:hypothetical protein
MLFAQSTGARISGTVLSETGTPIAGAVVTALRSVPRPGTAGTATADASGRFEITALSAGAYTLCAQVARGDYVDACLWSTSPARVTVSRFQFSGGNDLRLAKGSRLRVRINDASQQLKAPATGGKPHHVLLGAWTPAKTFIPLGKVREDVSGIDYQLTIPFGTPVQLSVTSNVLELKDERGAIAPEGGLNVNVTHAKGQAEPPALTFVITGKVR